MTDVYWVAWRVATDATDEQRRDSIYAAIMKQKPNGGRWYEPTSFGIVESDLSASALIKAITAGLDAKKDLLIAADVHNAGDCAYFGAVKEADRILKTMLPLAVKV